jgi:hypothetical protein
MHISSHSNFIGHLNILLCSYRFTFHASQFIKPDFEEILDLNTLKGNQPSDTTFFYWTTSTGTGSLKYIYCLLFSAVLAREILLVFVSVNSPEKRRKKKQLNWGKIRRSVRSKKLRPILL